jgi:hypothetical protein
MTRRVILHPIKPVLTNFVTDEESTSVSSIPVNRYDIKYVRAFCRGRWGDDWFSVSKSEKYNRKKLAVAAFEACLPSVDNTTEAENLGRTYEKGDRVPFCH